MKKILTIAATLLVSVVAHAADPATAPVSTPATTTAPMASEKTVGATVEKHILLSPKDVKWGEGPGALQPGAKMAVIEGDPKTPNALFTIRIKLPAGFKIQAHSHPADEHVTVISGTFQMGMGDAFDAKALTSLPAGSFAVMPKGHHHFASAKGETVVQVHGVGPWGITYVNPTDDPRNAKAADPKAADAKSGSAPKTN